VASLRNRGDIDIASHKVPQMAEFQPGRADFRVMIDEVEPAPGDQTTQRLDKWLWFARLAKTRSLAQKLIQDGQVRVNRERVIKPAQTVRPGDMVSVEIGDRLRLLEVIAPGIRRGPASEAAGLFRDLAPQPPRGTTGGPAGTQLDTGLPARDPGTGRPTKRERRRTDRLRDR
jgi:ribosome-associated heat shock protein Hsp15